MKKQYISPEMELLIIESSDICSSSGDVSGGAPGTSDGSNVGEWDKL